MDNFLYNEISSYQNTWRDELIVTYGRKQYCRLPFEFFIDKIIKEGYEIVLTGHSLGSALAVLVTISILMSENFFKYKDKVLFIGFGTPSFLIPDGNLVFNIPQIVDDIYDNFHFYFNENDILLTLIEKVIYYPLRGYSDSSFHKKQSIFLSFFIRFVEDIIVSVNSQIDKGLLLEFMHLSELYLYKDLYLYEDVYLQDCLNGQIFGQCFTITPVRLQIDSKFEIKKKLINLLRKNIEQGNVDDINFHFQSNSIKNCFNDLKSIVDEHFNFNVELNTQIIKSYDFNLKHSVKVVTNKFSTDIFLTLSCEINEFITRADLLIDGNIIKFQNSSASDEDKIMFAFSVKNEFFLRINLDSRRNMIKKVNLQFLVHSQLGNIHIDSEVIVGRDTLANGPFNFSNSDLVNGLTLKEEEIESLPAALLYMHAVFFVNFFQNGGIDCPDDIRNGCKRIEDELTKIDAMWCLTGTKHNYKQIDFDKFSP